MSPRSERRVVLAKRAGLIDDRPFPELARWRVCCFGNRLDNGSGNKSHLAQSWAFDVTYLTYSDSQ